MKVVVAVDSFKGSLSSISAGNAVKEGILRADSSCEVIVKPLADGGEGTTEALVEGMGGRYIEVEVMGPLEKTVKARYGYIESSNTAVMEMAEAAGITLVGNDKNPLNATTYGVGEMIKDAVKRGIRNFIIGIGGSATNDGGIGMLSALGFRFLDNEDMIVDYGARGLDEIATIDCSEVMEELKDCSFKVACDVKNPLCGENGATYIYGPQKGVTEELKPVIDSYMHHYAEVTKKFMGKDCKDYEGAGAAGGLGFAFLSYLNSRLVPGIELVMEAVGLEDCIKGSDYVVTGEGRLDNQTAMGKAPMGVASIAKKYGAKVIAVAGCVTDGASVCNTKGIDAYFPVVDKASTLEEAMDSSTASKNVARTAEQIFRLINAVK